MRASLRFWPQLRTLACEFVASNHSVADVWQKPPTDHLNSLKQHTNSVLLDMVIDPKTEVQLKPFVFKECYSRLPSYSPSDSLQLLRLFIDSRVPTHVCLKAAQSIVSKTDALTDKERLEMLKILYDSSASIVAYNIVIKCLLCEIQPDLVSTKFLLTMWYRSVDRFASLQPTLLVKELIKMSVKRVDSLDNEELDRMLNLFRRTNAFSGDDIDLIHSNIITHRRDRHDLMAHLVLVLYNTLRYNVSTIESYLQVLRECIESGDISPESIELASVMAKQNFYEPKIFEELEPYVIDLYIKRKFGRGILYSYLYACIIADYFPKKFIKLFATPDKILSIIHVVESTPFLKSGVELCTVVDYARVKGVDLGLSEEVNKLFDKLSYTFCKKSWEFHCNELNPWENRAKDLIRRKFTLYSAWPTRAGYFIDGCLFFDDKGNTLSLDDSASILLELRKSCATFEKSGLEVKPIRTKIDFDLIWDVVNNRDLLKNVPNKLVIEFNGPFHFLNAGRRRTNLFRIDGPTMLRRKYLQASGWDYIGIPFFQFEHKVSTYTFCNSISKFINHIIYFKNNK